jgi:hypothetical protein
MRSERRAAVVAARERRAKVEGLYLRGEGNRRTLATIFGVGKSTIQNDIDRIEREWKMRKLAKSDKERTRAVAFYEYIKREALNEWERSKEAAAEVPDEDDGEETKGKRPRKKEVVNLTCLQEARKAQERIDKICGNESPIHVEEKVEVSVVDKQQQKSLRDVGKELGLDFSRIGTG